MRRYYRGQVYYANLNPVVGSEQGGDRPVLILQNNTGNRYANTVIVAAISSKRDAKHSQPTHCPIRQFGVLEHPSVVLLEQLRTIDKSRLRRYVGSLSRQIRRYASVWLSRGTYAKRADFISPFGIGVHMREIIVL